MLFIVDIPSLELLLKARASWCLVLHVKKSLPKQVPLKKSDAKSEK